MILVSVKHAEVRDRSNTRATRFVADYQPLPPFLIDGPVPKREHLEPLPASPARPAGVESAAAAPAVAGPVVPAPRAQRPQRKDGDGPGVHGLVGSTGNSR